MTSRRFGLGVADEVKYYIEKGKPAWKIVPIHMPTSDDLKNFEQNPLNGLFSIQPITTEETTLILTQNRQLVIPHEETRLRTWLVYNQKRRPYEEAHLVKMPIPEGFYPKEKM